jgi:hypothetical protein
MSTLRVNNIDNLGLDDVITNGVVEKRALPAGSVLQVVSVTDGTARTTTSTSYTSATISVSITPTQSTSRFLVQWNFNAYVGTVLGDNIRTARYSIFDGTNNIVERELTVYAQRESNLVASGTPATVMAYVTHSNVATTFTGRFRTTNANWAAEVRNNLGAGLLTVMEIAG